MTQRLEFTRPMMRRRAGLYANEARRQLLKERQNVAALELTAHHHIAVRVDAVNLENRLCDVETDRRDRLHVCLLRIRPPHRRPWHLRADEGAVHSIRNGRDGLSTPLALTGMRGWPVSGSREALTSSASCDGGTHARANHIRGHDHRGSGDSGTGQGVDERAPTAGPHRSRRGEGYR